MKLFHISVQFILSVIALLIPVSAFASTYTFNGAAGDGNWSNAANWSTGIVASTSDTAIVTNSITSSDYPVVVATLLVNNNTSSTTKFLSIPITATNGAIFEVGAYNYGTINASTTFEFSSRNFGAIVGTSTFDSAANVGTTTGTTTFESSVPGGYSENEGVVNGPVRFIGQFASNGGADYIPGGTKLDPNGISAVVHGSASFNNSFNFGAVTGNVNFFNGSNNAGLVVGTTTFSDTSSNEYGYLTFPGTVRGAAFFTGSSFNGGLVQGDAYYYTNAYSSSTPETNSVFTIDEVPYDESVTGTSYGSDNIAFKTYVFNGGSINVSTIVGTTTFNDTSRNQGRVLGNATFNGSSGNNGVIQGNAVLNTNYYSSTTPIASGTVTLSGSQYLSGQVLGTTYGPDMIPITTYIFNNASYIASTTVNANIKLNTTAYQYPSPGTVTLGYPYLWIANITGNIIGPDNIPINTYVFTTMNGIYAGTTIQGNAIFAGTSTFNHGTITGNATVYYPSPNPIGGTVIGTLTYISTSYNPYSVPTPVTTGITYGGGSGRSSGSSHSITTHPGTASVVSGVANTTTTGTTTAATTNTTSGFVFTKSLALGQFSPDAHALQIFLNTHGFIVSPTGAGSPGNETYKFGLLTRYALKRFQNAHPAEILVPSGVSVGTGTFGLVTRNYINSIH